MLALRHRPSLRSGLRAAALALLVSALPAAAAAEDETAVGALRVPLTFPADLAPTFGAEAMANAWALVPTEADLCSRTDAIPYRYWREAYLSRDWARACAEAVRNYESYAKDERRNPAAVNATRRTQVETDYAAACLRRLEDVIDETATYRRVQPRTKTLILMTSLTEVRRLITSVGMLRSDDGPNCGGALVDLQDGRIHLLTAAHCLGDIRYVRDERHPGLGRAARRMSRLYGALDFEPLVGGRLRVTPTAGATALLDPLFDVSRQDLALIEIGPRDHLPAGIGIALLEAPLEAWEPLTLVGIHPFLDGPPHEALLVRASVTLDPRCTVLSNDEGKLLHNCQTIGQLSGSPMLVIRDGVFRVGAVHTGGDLLRFDSCGPDSLPARNRAITVQMPSRD